MADIRNDVEEKKSEAPSFTEEVSSQPSPINSSPEVDHTKTIQTKGMKKKSKKNGGKKGENQQSDKQVAKTFEEVAHTCAKQAVAAAELAKKAPHVSQYLKEISHELALASARLLVAVKANTAVAIALKQLEGTEQQQNGTSLRFPRRYYQASSNLGRPPSPVPSARSDSLFIERRFKNPHGDRRRRRGRRPAESQLGRETPSVAPEQGEHSPPGDEADAAALGKRPRVQQPVPQPSSTQESEQQQQQQQQQPPEQREQTQEPVQPQVVAPTASGASDCPDSESG